MKGIIIAGGEIPPKTEIAPFLSGSSLIIAADHGFDHAKALGLSPDILIGDMDSIRQKEVACEVLTYPTEKDETDSELALLYAIQKGCSDLVLLGMTGARLDHSLANLLLLKTCIKHHVQAVFLTPGNECYLICRSIKVTGKKGDLLSLIPLTDCEGVATSGLRYTLRGECLTAGTSRGVSNQLEEKEAFIRLQSGYLYVIKPKERP